MTLWVKICGLSTTEAVDVAVAAGANAVGFVFHPASPRNVTPEVAARLAERVPVGIARIAVTRHPSDALLSALFAAFRPDVLQTDAIDLEGLALPAGVAILPVLRTGGVLPIELPARCLYESADSGQGAQADWSEAARLAARTRLILAGGLNPTSVAAAIDRVRPYGVDVSSGVESAPGRKDCDKIQAFIAAARAAAALRNDGWE
ncbi:MAG: phosphoribosylanthranilate isomerase [Pseudomonadota bacterium]|jgi:phosphoribosylanthranilate isomerase